MRKRSSLLPNVASLPMQLGEARHKKLLLQSCALITVTAIDIHSLLYCQGPVINGCKRYRGSRSARPIGLSSTTSQIWRPLSWLAKNVLLSVTSKPVNGARTQIWRGEVQRLIRQHRRDLCVSRKRCYQRKLRPIPEKA